MRYAIEQNFITGIVWSQLYYKNQKCTHFQIALLQVPPTQSRNNIFMLKLHTQTLC